MLHPRMSRLPAPIPQTPAPMPRQSGPKTEGESRKNVTSIVPGVSTGKAKKKGGAKGKKSDKSGELDRVVREDAGLAALTELTREDRQDRRSRGRALVDGRECEMPRGHSVGFHPVEGRAFQEDGAVPPQFGDIVQGNLSDAWLLACFAAVAERAPGRLLERIEELEPGVFDVRLDDERVRVTAEFPSEGYAAAHPRGESDLLWVALLEKAFALREAGSYAHLETGNPARALEALMGREARRTSVSRHVDPERVWTVLTNAEAHAQPVVVVTKDVELPQPLVADHVFAVLSAWEGPEGPVLRLFNPWGARERDVSEMVHEVPLSLVVRASLALYVG